MCNVANSKVTTGNARIAYHSFRVNLKNYCSFSLMFPNFAFDRSPMLKRLLGKESQRGWEWMQTHKCIPYWHRHKEATHCLNCRHQRHIQHTVAQSGVSVNDQNAELHQRQRWAHWPGQTSVDKPWGLNRAKTEGWSCHTIAAYNHIYLVYDTLNPHLYEGLTTQLALELV